MVRAFGILELVGSNRHRQLRHALGGGEQRAAGSVVHGEVDPGQHQILTDEALHPDRIRQWSTLGGIEIGPDGDQHIQRELGQSSQGFAHQVNRPPADGTECEVDDRSGVVTGQPGAERCPRIAMRSDA